MHRFELQQATGPRVVAEVLVSTIPFSARYDLDRKLGIISREGHPLQGQSIRGRILVAPGVQGGVAAGWAFPAMAHRGVCFGGMVLGDINPVMVQGAVTAGMPIAVGFSAKLLDILKTGKRICLEPATCSLTILD